MTLDVTRVQFFKYSHYCCIILPRCEYWTILWCATGGNREKNLLDSSISLSTAAVSSESFTLLFSVFKSCSSRIVAELRPKGLNPRVAASFVFCLFQRQNKKSQFFTFEFNCAFTNCSFKMNGIFFSGSTLCWFKLHLVHALNKKAS